MSLFAELVRAHATRGGASHRPSDSFCGVLAELDLAAADGTWGAEIVCRTGYDSAVVLRLLARMRRYGLVTVRDEVGDAKKLGRGLRRYHTLTPLGADLVRECLV